MTSLEGQVAIVTGGASGIGRACVSRLARAGCNVTILDVDRPAAERAANALTKEVRILIAEADVSNLESVRRAFDMTESSVGSPQILVNCAALFVHGPAIDISQDAWERLFAVNVQGVVNCSQLFAQQLLRHALQGAIVNISSINSTHSAFGRTAYSATKAALNSITRSHALEFAQYGIRVNAVAPGHTNTEGIRDSVGNGWLDIDSICRRIPMGRIAEPHEIAEAVSFLCSDSASFITGQTLFVDGGYTANGGW